MFRLVSCVIRTMVCYAEHTDTHLGTGDRDRTASGCARATQITVFSRRLAFDHSATAPEIDAHAARGGARAARGGGPAPRPRARARRPPRPGGERCDVCVPAGRARRPAPAAPARARAADDA